MSSPLDDIAPYPRAEDDVTAEVLARNLTVWAHAHRAHRVAATSVEDREWATSETVNLFGLVKVLKALQSVAPETADEVARDLWLDWDDGGSIGERLWSWLTGWGIDPDAVSAAVAEAWDRRQVEKAAS